MVSLLAALALAPVKLWRYELASPLGTATFDLVAMPKDAPIAVPKFAATGWGGREVDSIALDPVAREGCIATIRFKGWKRPLTFVFARFDAAGSTEPQETSVGLRCTLAVSRV